MANRLFDPRIGQVTLVVHDLDQVSGFYQRVIGLSLLAAGGGEAVLGAGGTRLLTLRQDRAARRSSRREAGLFHTAFLLPDRAALGRWLRHAAAIGQRIAGASDHAVSEAIYLADPEGNGIEVYADRPEAAWRWQDGQVTMGTEPLDLPALLSAGDGPAWNGAPDGTSIGHVHLQVGDTAAAEAFYAGRLGFGVTARYQGGSFFGADGYHHQLAANVWNSAGAGPRDLPSTGLAEVEIIGDRDERHLDPWGTAITLRRG
ncbi:glyoxalase [Pseudoroseomonas deserti]|uniref:Glyoxalase n=1 Tax=Teichococcus deserti TaxID=1817963 RepID=A0A1V2H789_9PROT|nr:VOC family protein [Pseudoroseomonas deserti]ONG56010.1 glyoxalase [Pseudoroseomonas deserti]